MDLAGSSNLEWLPKNYEGSWTLGESVSRKGICLHSGQESEVTLLPYEDIGFHLSWVNRSERPIRLNSNQVVHSELCTTLDLTFESLATVEHLLAALAGCGLTHVHIVVSGNEVPLLDGSAMGWVEAISEAGMISLNDSSNVCPVLKNALIINTVFFN